MRGMNDCIFHFVYDAALRDATLRNAYMGSLSILRENVEAKELVRAYIDRILSGRAGATELQETLLNVEQSFARYLMQRDPKNVFTFGNTQKLVNMTAKYIFIACYADEALRENFRFCHCPMDSIMVDVVMRELDNVDQASLCPNDLQVLQRFQARGNKTCLKKPWSRILVTDREQYHLFQEIVLFLSQRQEVTPLEYDYLMWMKQE